LKKVWEAHASILVVAQDMERLLATGPVRALSGTLTAAYSVGQRLIKALLEPC
jgi:hypothetical protein